MDGWTVIGPEGTPLDQEPVTEIMAWPRWLEGKAGEAGETWLRYAGRDYVLRLSFTRTASGLVTAVTAELAEADGSSEPGAAPVNEGIAASTSAGSSVVARTRVRLLTPARELSRMDPYGRIRLRRALRGLLEAAAANRASAVS